MISYEYKLDADFRDGKINGDRFAAEIKATGLPGFHHVDTSGVECLVWFDSDLDDQGKQTLDGVVTSHRDDENDLAVVKQEKFDAIDARTDQLIGKGFAFQGKRFSMGIPSQSKFLAVDALRNDPMFNYPVRLNTIDDDDVLEIADAANIHGLFLTAVGAYRAYLDSGTTIKDEVRSASTVDEVNAIVDPR